MTTSLWSKLNTVESRIFWVSVLLLYTEILAIRWLGIEVSIVRAFPNLILLVFLVGASVGLNRTEKAQLPIWISLLCASFLILGLIFAVPLKLSNLSLRMDQNNFLGSIFQSISIFSCILASLTVISTSIGAKLGTELSKSPGLKAYSFNLLGSIFGVLLFGVISYFQIPPPGWLLLLGIITRMVTRQKIVIALTPLFVALSCFATLHSYWSPYSKLDVIPLPAAANSTLGNGNYVLNSNNHYFHFAVRSPSDNGDALDNQLKKSSEKSWQLETLSQYFRWLKLPFENSLSRERVLILGGGSGNDVDFALKRGARSVDVVEIDPIIASFGKSLHPEKPYIQPNVTLHVEDARTFLRYTDKKFDLIEFAYLDPGSTLSTSSFIRVDNFVYTVESIKSALEHLDKKGLGVISFATGPQHIVTRRLYQAITEAQGKPPLGLVSDSWDSVMFFFGPGASELNFDSEKIKPLRLWPAAGDQTEARPATDDWPFLYMDFNSNGLILYLAIIFTAVLMPVLISRKAAPEGPISGAAWGNMFFLGQAFILVEVKAITQLSVLFGATWIITSIVTLFVLTLAFLANWLASKRKSDKVLPFYICLLVALLVDYFFQIPHNSKMPFFLLAGLAALVNCLPIFFGGLIFSSCFKKASSPPAYLSANLLGVAIGGLTENLCVLTGIKSLVLVGMLLYALSYTALLYRSKDSSR